MNAFQGNVAANPAAQQMMAQFMQNQQQPLIKQPDTTTVTKKGTPLTPKGVVSNIVDETIMPYKMMQNGADWNKNRDSMEKAFGINELQHMFGGSTVTQNPNMQLSNQPPPIDWSAMLANS